VVEEGAEMVWFGVGRSLAMYSPRWGRRAGRPLAAGARVSAEATDHADDPVEEGRDEGDQDHDDDHREDADYEIDQARHDADDPGEHLGDWGQVYTHLSHLVR